MKKLLVFFPFFSSLLAYTQEEGTAPPPAIDSAKITQTYTLKRAYFGFIKSCVPTDDQPALVNIFRQVSEQVTPVYNPDQPITVAAESGSTLTVFLKMGMQQDFYANAINDSIQKALEPQITNPWLGRQLYIISKRNQQETERRIKEGDDFFLATKPQ